MESDLLQQRVKERNYARQLCGQLQSSKNYQLLLPKIIKLMAHSDIGVKRICYSTYAKHSQKVPGEALLAVNTILQDSCHQSPLVRALVLNTINYSKSEATAGILQRIISDGLKDTSAFVRRHAVIAQHYYNLHDTAQAEPFKMLVDDPDPIVSTLSLVTSPLKGSSEKTTLQMLNRLQNYTVEGMTQVISTLRDVTPSDENQLLDILNVIDSLLDSEHIEVVTATMDIFLQFSGRVDGSLAGDMHTRILTCSLIFLRSSDPCTVYCILLWLQECLVEYPPQEKTNPSNSTKSGKRVTTVNYEILRDNFHLLLDKSSDPSYISVLKLDILRLFISGDTVALIVDNVKSIVETRYGDHVVSDKAIRFLIDSSKAYPDSCKKAVCELMSVNQIETQICLLKHLHVITSYDDPACDQLFIAVLPKWKILNLSDLIILLNLCSKLAYKQDENLSHMLDMSKHILSPSSNCGQAVKSALLHALTECFKAEPAEYTLCLRECLTDLEKDNDLVLREQVKWCILKIKHIF